MSYRMQTTVETERTRREIEGELRKWRQVSDYEIPLRLDRSQTQAFVRFVLRGIPITIQCSTQASYGNNLRCVFYAVQAMRMNEVRGIADTMKNAYAQLAAPAAERDPYEVLGLRPDAATEIVKAAYRALVLRHHPDQGGDAEAFKEIDEAMNAIEAERGVPPQ